MNLHLKSLTPIFLKDRLKPNSSDIWMQNLQFSKGGYFFIQAPSGTGKTTLIHCLYGLQSRYEGAVAYEGREIQRMTAKQLAALRATYLSIVFQDMRLFPQLTVWENLEIKRTLTQVISKELALDMLRRFHILDYKERVVKNLSFGEQQRVAIVRALCQPFSWLLMDEPFSHLDSVNKEVAISLISEMALRNDAGIIVADLESNHHFSYHQTLFL